MKGFIQTGFKHKIPGPFIGRFRFVGNKQKRTIKLFLLKVCFSHSSCVHLEIFYKKENNIKMISRK